jgi:hypothetical protein
MINLRANLDRDSRASEATFLFPNVSGAGFATYRNTSASIRQDLVKHIKPTVARYFGTISEPAMTSISATSSGSYLTPRELLQNQLQSEVSSGTISSSDETALSSALDDIDSALNSQRQSDSSTSGTGSSSTPPSSEDLKTKISDLIAGEVSSGKLTSAQATELQGVFSSAFANGGPGGAGGPGGPGGPGGGGGPGGPGGPPPSGGSSSASSSSLLTDASDSSSASSSSSSSSSSTSSTDDLLKKFLESLQESLSQGSAYSSSGNTSTSTSSITSLLLDYKS